MDIATYSSHNIFFGGAVALRHADVLIRLGPGVGMFDVPLGF
jgi:hypothetical protein